MKIDKAIQIIDLNLKDAHTQMPADVRTALKMSKDGLLRIQRTRTETPKYRQPLLEGETL